MAAAAGATSTRATAYDSVPYEDETGVYDAAPVVVSNPVRFAAPPTVPTPVYVHPQANDWWYNSGLYPSPNLGSRIDYQTLVSWLLFIVGKPFFKQERLSLYCC